MEITAEGLREYKERPHRLEELHRWLRDIGGWQEGDYLIDPRIGGVRLVLVWDMCDMDATATRRDGFERLDRSAGIVASARMFGDQYRPMDVVHRGNKISKCGSVLLSADQAKGRDGGDEVIAVDLDAPPPEVHRIVFCIQASSLDVEGFCAYVVRGSVGERQIEMCRYTRGSMLSRALLIGHLTRIGGFWHFRKFGLSATPSDFECTPTDLVSLSRPRGVPSFDATFRHVSVQIIRGEELVPMFLAGTFKKVHTSNPYCYLDYKGRKIRTPHEDCTLNPRWNSFPFDLGMIMETENAPLEVKVFHHDAESDDQFMGFYEIPARQLHNIGVGEHLVEVPLIPSKRREFESNANFLGKVVLKVKVEDVDCLTI